MKFLLHIHWVLAASAMAAVLAAEESSVKSAGTAAAPGVAASPAPGTGSQTPAATATKPAAAEKPEVSPEPEPDYQSRPSGSGTALPYDFVVPGGSAVPPDLSLASSRPFTLGLGPSAFGPGIRSSVNVGVLFDDNVLRQEENKESDLVLSAGLNIQAEVGTPDRGVALRYAIDGYHYVDHPDQDSVNHSLGLSLYHTWGRTQVSLDVGYHHLTGADRDVDVTTATTDAAGGATTQDVADARLSVVQGVGPRGRLMGGIDYSGIFYETSNSSQDFSGHLGFDHMLGKYSHVGIQGVVGYLTGGNGTSSTPAPAPAPAPAPVLAPGTPGPTTATSTTSTTTQAPSSSSGLDQTYEQLNLTFDYHATDRLNATGSVGWESRSTDGGETKGGFVYDLNLNYRFGRGTIVAARGSRHTVASAAYDNTDRLSTNFELSVTQPIGHRFTLNVAGGYEQSDYGGTQGEVGSGRQDTYMYLRPSLSAGLTSRLSMSLFYEFRKNDSSGADGASYQGNRLGTQLTYSF